MRAFLRAIGDWFFARGDPRVAASLRIAFCGLYLLTLWDFYPYLDLLFGHRGLFGTMEPFPFELRGFQFFLYRHDSFFELRLWLWGSVAVASMGLVGAATRVAVPLTYLSMFLFRERGPFITFGADLVMNCIGLWMLFLNSGSAWSIDAWWRRRRGLPARRSVELWPARAIQVQIALIYLVTGLVKLHTQPWQDGSAVYYALQVGNVLKGQSPSWVLGHRLLLVAMNYGTLAIELSVPFMLFYRPLRNWAFLMCAAMHTSIDLLMSIRFFSLAMYVGLLAFLEGGDWDRLGHPRQTLAQWLGVTLRKRPSATEV